MSPSPSRAHPIREGVCVRLFLNMFPQEQLDAGEASRSAPSSVPLSRASCFAVPACCCPSTPSMEALHRKSFYREEMHVRAETGQLPHRFCMCATQNGGVVDLSPRVCSRHQPRVIGSHGQLGCGCAMNPSCSATGLFMAWPPSSAINPGPATDVGLGWSSDPDCYSVRCRKGARTPAKESIQSRPR